MGELGKTNDMVGARTKLVVDGCVWLGADWSIDAEIGRWILC